MLPQRLSGIPTLNAAYGTKCDGTVTEPLSLHRAKHVTRRSDVVPLGTCEAILGSWVLWLATIPLVSAAKVTTCRACWPCGLPGYPCLKSSRMGTILAEVVTHCILLLLRSQQ